ncbi:MAG: hypothetical protein OES79_10325 [Planctomycetota bacterium]|nr:hypothetical protein [Planctomycetota bacterium]
MTSTRVPLIAYAVNATLLLCHEIDSAHWEEWTLFQLPGGSEGFVAVHIVLIGVVLWGLILVDRGHAWWRWFSLLLGLAGVTGGCLHFYFLLAGDARFSSSFSMGLIAAFLVTSLAQIAVTLLWWKARAKKGSELLSPSIK